MDNNLGDTSGFHPSELYAVVKGFSRDKPSVMFDNVILFNTDQAPYIIDNGVFGVNAEFLPKASLSNISIKKKFSSINAMSDYFDQHNIDG